jgi:hypothetical protein
MPEEKSRTEFFKMGAVMGAFMVASAGIGVVAGAHYARRAAQQDAAVFKSEAAQEQMQKLHELGETGFFVSLPQDVRAARDSGALCDEGMKTALLGFERAWRGDGTGGFTVFTPKDGELQKAIGMCAVLNGVPMPARPEKKEPPKIPQGGQPRLSL